MAGLFVGTSGFQYDEWKGSFYPEKLAKPKMLAYYAGRFPAVEINYTFRQMPKTATLEKWAAETPPGFKFSLKASQRITHFGRLRADRVEDATRYFCDTARALGERLGPHLFQLPPDFKKDRAVLRDFVAMLPRDQRHAFEFRNDSWFDDEVLGLLKEVGASLVVAEHEDGKATPVVRTAPFVYLRLRRPDYGPQDAVRWAKQLGTWIGEGADIYCYYKHEEEGKGPQFAQALREEMGGSGGGAGAGAGGGGGAGEGEGAGEGVGVGTRA